MMSKKKKSSVLVIKLGTRMLTSGTTNRLCESRIRVIVSQVSELVKRGFKVVLVSSGAIGAGMGILGLKTRPQFLPKLQACAAIGQGELMKIYSKLFKAKKHTVAQVLLTQDDLDSRERYLNAKNTLNMLLDSGVVPIVNENDTVSTEEIKLGDNDRLSSLVANLIEADKLIILTDVDNLYKYDKNKRKVAIHKVEKVTKEIEDLAGKSKNNVSVGGMITKIQAAKIATESGITCHMANGKEKDVLLKIADDISIGTLFEACKDCVGAKKRWIAFTSKKRGSISVDKGAKTALVEKNRSLLASGVLRADGNFEIGDVVTICDEEGKEFARGLVNYNSRQIDKIKGLNTSSIEQALGYKCYDEVVHKDNLVIL